MLRVNWEDCSHHCFRGDHELYREILHAREAADAKHGANSIEQIDVESPRWLPTLIEEVGEVAHTMTYDGPGHSLRAELVDVATVVMAWIDAIDAEAREGRTMS